MTRSIKLLSVVFLTLFLAFCQGGPVTRRASKFGMVLPPNTNSTQLAQTSNAFSKLAPLMPLNFIQPIPQTTEILPSEPPIETIDYTNAKNSRAACLGNGDVDTDKDGLPDSCDLEHFPYTFNGWIAGGRYFDNHDQRLTLTAEENAEWKRDTAERGGIGFGNISGEAQRLVKKFSALKKLSDSDVPALREIYYSYSDEPIRISDNYRSYNRSDTFQSNMVDDINLGLAAGDGDETVPYNINKPATNVAGLTVFGKDTDSVREQGRFKMFVYETNVVIPKNTDSLQVTIGHLSNQNFMMPPKTGMYYVINNGDSILLQNQLLSDKGYDFQGSRFGILKRDTGCSTAHLIVVYITDGSNDRRGQPILPEVIAFRASEKEPWTTLGQEYFTVQPQGGIECQQSFGANDIFNSKTFFKTATQVTRHVPGVVDFNSSLGHAGVANPYKMLDATSTSLDLIKAAASEKPVDKMTPVEVYEYEKSLVQIDENALKPEDKTWLQAELKKTEERKDALDPAKVTQTQLDQLKDLNGKLAALDPSSPEYATMSQQIEQLLAGLGKATLSEDQKKTLADQTNAYNAKKTAATAVLSPKALKIIADNKDATISLSADDISKLKDLGYTFRDAQGNEIPAGQAISLTPAQLDSILAQSGDELAKGSLDQTKAKSLSALLDSLKKNKAVDGKKIDQFKKDYSAKLKKAGQDPEPVSANSKLVELNDDGTVELSQDDMQKLTTAGVTFVNPEVLDKNGKPKVYDPVKNKGSKKISEEEADELLDYLGRRLNEVPMVPLQKQNILDVLESLKKAGVDPAKIDQFVTDHADKLYDAHWTPEQIGALNALDSDKSKAKPGLTEEMRKWSKGFPDQTTADAAKKTALEKIEKSLLDPTKKDFTTQEREAAVDDLKKTGFVDENKAEELKAKIGARGAFVDSQGNYHPEYAFLITLVKAARPDGTTFSAFKFNSTINFESGSAKVDPNGENVINGFLNFVNTVKKNGNIADTYFKIEAFTDATGTQAKNQQVSNSRAQTVKKYLIEKTGTPEDHVTAEGKGIDPLALSEPKKKGKYQPDIRFRRVEITFSTEPFTPKVPS